MVVGMLIAGLFTSSSMLMVPQSAAAAVITSIAPDSGPAAGGETLTVTGSGFQSDFGNYVPVDYIQFYKDASTAYYPLIDTGIQLKAATQVSVTYSVTTYGIQYVWAALSGSEIHLASGDGDPQNNSDSATWQYFYYGASGQSIGQFASLATSSGKIKVTSGNGSFAASLLGGTGHIYTASTTYTAYGNSANIVVGARQTGYFTGRIYGFSIVNGTVGSNDNVSFNGVPAYCPQSNQYGLYDTVSSTFFVNTKGANNLIEGQIWGPSGIGGASPVGTIMTVDFSGQNSAGTTVHTACSNLVVVNDTTATCTVPPSMLAGDGSGIATVTVKVTDASGTTTKTLEYTYEGLEPELTSIDPDSGSMKGGNQVTLTGVKFATLVDELQFNAATISTPPGTSPAAWTVNDQTVYGFLDQATGELTPASEGNGVVGLVDGQVVQVTPCEVKFGQTAATAVTVTSETTMTVIAPPHDPATVDVSLVHDGFSDSLTNAYTYVADGTLEITMEGWDCPPGALIDDGDDLCRVIPEGSWLISGARVTWVYTVTYVAIGVNGQPLDPSLGQLTDVMVNDAKQGWVCTIDTLRLNEPNKDCNVTGTIAPG